MWDTQWFIIQSETAPQISEALKVLSKWNPTWKPKYFMTDYCDAEMSAIEEVFPRCQTYLCDFHREQCWERWVKDRKHGLSQTDAEVLLSLLRNCAHAEPDTSSDGTAFDHSYQQQVGILKQSYIWEKNQQVREWLKTKWLLIPQVLIIICMLLQYNTMSCNCYTHNSAHYNDSMWYCTTPKVVQTTTRYLWFLFTLWFAPSSSWSICA